MNSERLHNLLRQADTVHADALHADALPAAANPSPAALAASVRRLSRQRRQRAALLGAGLAVVVTASAAWQAQRFAQVANSDAPLPAAPLLATQSSAVPSPAAQTPAEQMQAALATIDSEQRLVERLISAERLDRARALTDTLQAPLGLPAANVEQLNRAASAIVLAAEQKQQRPQLLAAARDDYSLLVQLFPNTPWADLAQDRLMNIAPPPTP